MLEEADALQEAWEKLLNTADERSQSVSFPLSEVLDPEEIYLTESDIPESLDIENRLEFKRLHFQSARSAPAVERKIPTSSHEGLRESILNAPGDGGELGKVAGRFRQWLDDDLTVHWVLRSRAKAERMRDHMASMEISCHVADPTWEKGASYPSVMIHVGELSGGFLSKGLGVVFLTDEEIFGPRKIFRPSRPSRSAPSLTHLEDLKDNDLVVHVSHGIGIYRGLKTLEIGSVRGDFLHLEYLGGDKLYVPADRLQCVHKYLGSEDTIPRIDRLGGAAWEKRKKKVSKAVARMAKELLSLYASREVTEGHAFSVMDAQHEEFEETFPFEETPDQRRAIDEVMADMSSARPMDRLVCGDVGFGKTEVAIRAAFRSISDGKQVAYLVPTTILAEQQYETFRERFRDYPVFVDVLSRFRSPKEQKDVLERCVEGKVDILIGTHRLIQKDVRFFDLGLLIMDEEHRFGVAQKERLKSLRKEVDVLTLTATPIPRTMHMALLGIRDLSIIDTPPPDRLSIHTVLAAFEEELVCEAVHRELARGGQVFFVHNRVRGIERIADLLKQWLPGLRIGIAHGQMPERELAGIMDDFHQKKIDLLVCTTIIQSGLDIPSANTILINDAQNLGLAEIYQIRGRVGRSGRRAYAYLLTPSGGRGLTKDAERRLQTLQEFTELGAGYRIAAKDLEIRGAGTLLGPSQSGHLDAVGFELYTQLMRRAISEIKGEELPPEIEPEIHVPLNASLPEDYIPDPHQRLALYRRLSRVESEDHILQIREEMEDRFGPLPDDGANLLQLMALKCLIRPLCVQSLFIKRGRLLITFHPSTPISPMIIVQLIQNDPDMGLRFDSANTLELPLDIDGDDSILITAAKQLKGLLRGVSIKTDTSHEEARIS